MNKRVKYTLSIVVFVSVVTFCLRCILFNYDRNPVDQECFMMLVGKGASADGSVLLAHNNDLSGKEASVLRKYPAQDYESNDSVAFPSGRIIPQFEHTYGWMALQLAAGFAEGDAVAINEQGVCIAGGVALKADRNSRAVEADPLMPSGLNGGVRYIALQRSITARECVKTLGDLYTTYGVTYPGGVGIADSSEIWYIESGGGHTWAAIRIPDTCYWVQANGYRIENVDPSDTMNFYCSPELLSFCCEHNLWNPREGEFSFAKAFGGGRQEQNLKPCYDSRRIWQAIEILSPSLKMDANQHEFPLFLVPDVKIDLQKCFSILRNRYEGTPFENRIDDKGIDGERAIASWNTVHTSVIQIQPGKPVGIGAVLWSGFGPPQTCFYVPVCFGIDSIPENYTETALFNNSLSVFRTHHDLSLKPETSPELLELIRLDQIELEGEWLKNFDAGSNEFQYNAMKKAHFTALQYLDDKYPED